MGIDMAKGKYIGIVETDDFIASDMYEKLYDIAESHNLDYAKELTIILYLWMRTMFLPGGYSRWEIIRNIETE